MTDEVALLVPPARRRWSFDERALPALGENAMRPAMQKMTFRAADRRLSPGRLRRPRCRICRRCPRHRSAACRPYQDIGERQCSKDARRERRERSHHCLYRRRMGEGGPRGGAGQPHALVAAVPLVESQPVGGAAKFKVNGRDFALEDDGIILSGARHRVGERCADYLRRLWHRRRGQGERRRPRQAAIMLFDNGPFGEGCRAIANGGRCWRMPVPPRCW